LYGDEREAVKRESGAADGRDPFPPDLVRQVPQGDLTRYRDQADKAQGAGGRHCGKADLDQIFGLMTCTAYQTNMAQE
jgi:hypothetical protein